jgi:hypothetical protein
MKKVLLLSLTLLLCVSVSFSQFGIKGGINLGTIGGADKDKIGTDPKPRFGLAGGISYKLDLIMGLSIQPEVLYVQKGVVYEGTMTQGSYSLSGKSTFKLDYIDIPVLVKFNLPVPVLSPYIEAGASYGILLSAKEKDEITTTNIPGMTPGSSETDIKNSISKNDLSFLIGLGVELSILDINIRYMIGTSRLFKDNPDTPLIDENAAKIYNRGFMLTAGLRF